MALTHYFDVRLRPDADIHPAHALAALFMRLHRYLVNHGDGATAVSFPDLLKRSANEVGGLGNVLRLHGNAEALAPLAQSSTWGGAASLAEIGQVEKVPEYVEHRQLRRVQVDSNPERLMRRAMKRKGLTEADVRERYANVSAERSRLPFLALSSQSTAQVFRLFLDLGQPQFVPIAGTFNAYGLSAQGTVPCF